MPTIRSKDGIGKVENLVTPCISLYPHKFLWFQQRGYLPHLWQILFHGAHRENAHLTRMRHLAAGRRGGKTLSAAWEVAYYSQHPQMFWRDAHGKDCDDPLWIWVVAKSYKLVRIALLEYLKVFRRCGLQKGRDFQWNKSEGLIEFPDGTMVEFRTADDPDNLRGPGIDILWLEEAAMLPSDEPWNVIRPALSDKLGILITTTTPKGKNWLWEEFWKKLVDDPNQCRIEYTSIDNPYFAREEWEYAKQTYHPLMFKQEYMGEFEAMAGVALSGEWLHYYVLGRDSMLGDDDDIRLIPKDGKLPLRTYLAIDPATGEGADDFAMSLVGIAEDDSQAYLLKTYKQKIPFPDQVDLIQTWAQKYRPTYIGVESNAYQRVLAQQTMRLPGLPNIIPVFTTGRDKDSKKKRIMAMSPLFKTGRIRIHRSQRDFIDQWISYDPSLAKPKDDLLDATEIALNLAGILLPREIQADDFHPERTHTLQEEAEAHLALLTDKERRGWDEELGSEFF
ncbi:MAG: phage terminase large subunit [Patescibacteria group bacterium]|nr:phage terminase large subunit [Patescibacteria group bacterium]